MPWVRWVFITCPGDSVTVTGPNNSPVTGYLLPLGSITYVQYWKVWEVEVLFVAFTVYPRVPPRGIDVESGTRITLTLGSVRLNVAVTDLAASIVTVHVPVPVHAPDQPPKVEPVEAAAVSVTTVP